MTILDAKDNINADVEFDFCFSTLRWSAFILSTIRKLATWISDGRFFTSLGIDELQGQRIRVCMALEILCRTSKYRQAYKNSGSKWRRRRFRCFTSTQMERQAHAYFQTTHADDVRTAMEELRECFVDHGINDKSVPLILIFDEARTLCEYEAYDGARIHEEHATHFHQPKLTPECTLRVSVSQLL